MGENKAAPLEETDMFERSHIDFGFESDMYFPDKIADSADKSKDKQLLRDSQVYNMYGTKHMCAFQQTSNSGLPFLSSENFFLKVERGWQKYMYVTETPMAFFFYTSQSGVIRERRRQYESPYKMIIHPFSRFRVICEFFMSVIFFVGFLTVPLNPALYKISYEYHNKFPADFVYLYFMCTQNVLNFIYVIITCMTGVPNADRREVYLDPQSILCHYLVSLHIISDVICAIPFQLIAHLLPIETNRTVLKILELLPLARIFRLRTFYIYAQRMCGIWHLDVNHTRIVQYTLITLIICLWVTCFNCIIPLYLFPVNTFLSETADDEPEYILATNLYRTMSFLLAIAQINGIDGIVYSAIDHNGDRLLVIVTIIIGFIMCNLLFVLVVKLTLSLKTSQSTYEAIMNQLSNYMTHKQLPAKMQQKLAMYYEYRFQKSYYHECAILSILSDTLQSEIHMHTFKSLIDKVPLLSDLPHDVIGEMINHLTHEIFLPNDIIMKAYAPGDCMYFINYGTVSVSTPNGREICHLQDGSYFGEIALVTRNSLRVATVVAIEICEVYRLDRKGFLSCYATNAVLLKRIEHIANYRMKKCNLLEELQKKYLIERALRKGIERDDKKMYTQEKLQD